MVVIPFRARFHAAHVSWQRGFKELLLGAMVLVRELNRELRCVLIDQCRWVPTTVFRCEPVPNTLHSEA